MQILVLTAFLMKKYLCGLSSASHIPHNATHTNISCVGGRVNSLHMVPSLVPGSSHSNNQ